VDFALVGDVRATLESVLPKVGEKSDSAFLEKHLAETREFDALLNHYVEKGPGIKPIRPEYLAATLSEVAAEDALFFADTGTACIWMARHIRGGTNRRLLDRFHGHRWRMRRRMPLAHNWRIRAGRRLRCAGMAGSPCWRSAIY
jgi:pyruvate dehydrogenase (quinone)